MDGVVDGLGEMIRDLVRDVHQELAELDQRITTYNRRIRHLFRTNEECQRIGKIEGIGPITATALVAAVGGSCQSNLACDGLSRALPCRHGKTRPF